MEPPPQTSERELKKRALKWQSPTQVKEEHPHTHNKRMKLLTGVTTTRNTNATQVSPTPSTTTTICDSPPKSRLELKRKKRQLAAAVAQHRMDSNSRARACIRVEWGSSSVTVVEEQTHIHENGAGTRNVSESSAMVESFQESVHELVKGTRTDITGTGSPCSSRASTPVTLPTGMSGGKESNPKSMTSNATNASRESGKLRLKLTLGTGNLKPRATIPLLAETKTACEEGHRGERIGVQDPPPRRQEKSREAPFKGIVQAAPPRSIAKSHSGTRLSISISKPKNFIKRDTHKRDDVPSLKRIEPTELSKAAVTTNSLISSKESCPQHLKSISSLGKKVYSGTFKTDTFRTSVGEISDRKGELKRKGDLTRKTSGDSLKTVPFKSRQGIQFRSTIKKEFSSLKSGSKKSNLTSSSTRKEDNCIMPDVVKSWFGKGEKKKSSNELGGKFKDKKSDKTTTTGAQFQERKVLAGGAIRHTVSNVDLDLNRTVKKKNDDKSRKTTIKGKYEDSTRITDLRPDEEVKKPLRISFKMKPSKMKLARTKMNVGADKWTEDGKQQRKTNRDGASKNKLHCLDSNSEDSDSSCLESDDESSLSSSSSELPTDDDSDVSVAREKSFRTNTVKVSKLKIRGRQKTKALRKRQHEKLAIEKRGRNVNKSVCSKSRPLTSKELRDILREDVNVGQSVAISSSWVRRSTRQPSRSGITAPNVRALVDKLEMNDPDMVVLKLKKYLNDPDTPNVIIDAMLDALERNTNCQALYIQNFNEGMGDEQILHLLRILQRPSCKIWCLNIGENYKVKRRTWAAFTNGLKQTNITHMYASEHTISGAMKEKIREIIRENRSKHNMHIDPENLDIIVQCTHCWWNPINAKVLQPYLKQQGYDEILRDKVAQGTKDVITDASKI